MPWDQGPGLRCPGALVPGFPSKVRCGITVTDAAPFSRGPLIGLGHRNTRPKQVSFGHIFTTFQMS
jgi:hypothetical protein